MPVGLDEIITQIDSDLDEMLQPIVKQIHEAIDSSKTGTLPKAKLKTIINQNLTHLFGASQAEVPFTSFGEYVQSALTTAKSAGFGAPVGVDPKSKVNGSTTPIRIKKSTDRLQKLLNLNVEEFKQVKTPEDKEKAKQFFSDFLSVKGAFTPGATSTVKGAHEFRRTLLTEVTRAHGDGIVGQALLKFKRVRWKTSSGHLAADVCDERANTDNGFGPGVYNPSEVPPYPSHPYCRCRLELVDPAIPLNLQFAGDGLFDPVLKKKFDEIKKHQYIQMADGSFAMVTGKGTNGTLNVSDMNDIDFIVNVAQVELAQPKFENLAVGKALAFFHEFDEMPTTGTIKEITTNGPKPKTILDVVSDSGVEYTITFDEVVALSSKTSIAGTPDVPPLPKFELSQFHKDILTTATSGDILVLNNGKKGVLLEVDPDAGLVKIKITGEVEPILSKIDQVSSHEPLFDVGPSVPAGEVDKWNALIPGDDILFDGKKYQIKNKLPATGELEVMIDGHLESVTIESVEIPTKGLGVGESIKVGDTIITAEGFVGVVNAFVPDGVKVEFESLDQFLKYPGGVVYKDEFELFSTPAQETDLEPGTVLIDVPPDIDPKYLDKWNAVYPGMMVKTTFGGTQVEVVSKDVVSGKIEALYPDGGTETLPINEWILQAHGTINGKLPPNGTKIMTEEGYPATISHKSVNDTVIAVSDNEFFNATYPNGELYPDEFLIVKSGPEKPKGPVHSATMLSDGDLVYDPYGDIVQVVSNEVPTGLIGAIQVQYPHGGKRVLDPGEWSPTVDMDKFPDGNLEAAVHHTVDEDGFQPLHLDENGTPVFDLPSFLNQPEAVDPVIAHTIASAAPTLPVKQTVGHLTTGDVVQIKPGKKNKYIGEQGTLVGFSPKGTTAKVIFPDGKQASYEIPYVQFVSHEIVPEPPTADLPGPAPKKFAIGEKVTIKEGKGLKNIGQEGVVVGFSPKGTTLKVKFDNGTQASYEPSYVAKGAPSAPPPPPVVAPHAPVPPPTQVHVPVSGFDMSTMVKVGGQAGSNPGGFYQDPTGQKWYVKSPQGADAAKKIANEVLAAKLYELAGIKVPTLETTEFEGKPAIASKIVDVNDLTLQKMVDAKAHEGFAVDAWLANWDVIGNGSAQAMNLKTIKGTGEVIRLDTGGALLYRAQGGLKGTAFGNTVTELKTLRDPQHASSYAVFGKMTDEQIMSSMEKVLAVQPQDIRKIVMQYGPGTLSERTLLADQMVSRRYDIQLEYNKLVAKTIPAAPAVVDPPSPYSVPETTAGVKVGEKVLFAGNEEWTVTAVYTNGSIAAKNSYGDEYELTPAEFEQIPTTVHQNPTPQHAVLGVDDYVTFLSDVIGPISGKVVAPASGSTPAVLVDTNGIQWSIDPSQIQVHVPKEQVPAPPVQPSGLPVLEVGVNIVTSTNKVGKVIAYDPDSAEFGPIFMVEYPTGATQLLKPTDLKTIEHTPNSKVKITQGHFAGQKATVEAVTFDGKVFVTTDTGQHTSMEQEWVQKIVAPTFQPGTVVEKNGQKYFVEKQFGTQLVKVINVDTGETSMESPDNIAIVPTPTWKSGDSVLITFGPNAGKTGTINTISSHGTSVQITLNDGIISTVDSKHLVENIPSGQFLASVGDTVLDSVGTKYTVTDVANDGTVTVTWTSSFGTTFNGTMPNGSYTIAEKAPGPPGTTIEVGLPTSGPVPSIPAPAAAFAGPASKFALGETVTIKPGKKVKNPGEQGIVIGASSKGTTVKVQFPDGKTASYEIPYVGKGLTNPIPANAAAPSHGAPAKTPGDNPPVKQAGDNPNPDDVGQTVHYHSNKVGGWVEGKIVGISPNNGKYLVDVGNNKKYEVSAAWLKYGPKSYSINLASAAPAYTAPTYSSNSAAAIPAEGKDQKAHANALLGGFKPLKAYPSDKQVADAPPQWVQKWKNFLATLPQKQKAALNTWSGGAFSSINHHLRADKRAETHTTYKNTILEIDKAMESTATEEDMVIYRSGTFGKQWQEFNSLNPGDFVYDPGFTAMAVVAGAFGAGTYQVRIPKGSQGIYIDSISSYGEHSYKPEREFLMPRGSKFKVVNANPLIFELIGQGVPNDDLKP